MEYLESLQPHMFGFSLERLQSLMGGNDREALQRLVCDLDARDEDVLIEHARAIKQVLEDAVCRGVPFAGLVAESEPHVLAATMLAEHNQELTPVETHDWQMSAFWALADQFACDLEPEALKLLQYFCTGRPLFGKIIETERLYYGYLTLSELRLLSDELAELERYIRDWEDAGTLEFLRDLIEWLGAISEAGQDLWFYDS